MTLPTDEKQLTYAQHLALKDCSVYRRGDYTWKPKTMQKLATLGYVEKLYKPSGTAYALTVKGHNALVTFVP